MDVRSICVGGQHIRVATSPGGEGTCPLLFFNGLGADLDVAHGFAAALAPFGIGIVIFDVPGIGGSSLPALPYRFAWLAHLAHELLSRLGISGRVDVLGMSWGGALAQEFAHRYPQRVRSLILAATSAGTVCAPGRWTPLARLFDPRTYLDPERLARMSGELYGGKIGSDAAALRALGKLPPPLGCALQLAAVTGWTSVLWLRSLRVPALVMMGTDDPIVPLANGHLLVRLLPDARLVTIDDGHVFLLTNTAKSARIIADFLAGCGGSANDEGRLSAEPNRDAGGYTRMIA